MGNARVLGALLQDFLLAFAVGDKIAIHAHISTVDRLCHPTPPEGLEGLQYIKRGKARQSRLAKVEVTRNNVANQARTSLYWEMIMSDVLLMVKLPGRVELGSNLRGSTMKLKLYETTTFTSQSGALFAPLAEQFDGFLGQDVLGPFASLGVAVLREQKARVVIVSLG